MAVRKRCTRPSKLVYVPSRSTQVDAGSTQCAWALVQFALEPVKTTVSTTRSASSTSRSGKEPAKRSCPKIHRSLSRRAPAASMIARASPLKPSSSAPREEVFVGHLRRRDDADLLRLQAFERAGHGGDRLLPRHLGARAAFPLRGRGEPLRGVHESEAVAPGVAEPPRVDLRVEPRLEPRHAPALGVMRTAAIDVDLDVAAARAARADRLGGVEVPDAHLETEVPVGQGADGADVDDIRGVLVVELAPREQTDLGVVAALEDAELARVRDLVAEAHAARAEDAALGVEDDVRSERHRLRLVDLLVLHPRVVEAMLHVVD